MLKVVYAPLSIVSKSISQIHIKKTSSLIHSNVILYPYFIKITFILIVFIIPISILVIFLSPTVFEIIFGSAWKESGVYLQIYMPAIAVKFVVSTLSGALVSCNRIKLLALWQVVGFIITLVVLPLFLSDVSPEKAIFVLLIIDVSLYLLYYIFIIFAILKPKGIN